MALIWPLRHLLEKLPRPQAAASLFLTVKTIEFHLHNVYRKLDIRSRTELAVWLARDQGAA